MIVTNQIRFLIFLGVSSMAADILAHSETKATTQTPATIESNYIQNGTSEKCCGCKNILDLNRDNAKAKNGSQISNHAHFLCQKCLGEEICKMTSFFDHKCTGCAQMLGYSKMVAFIAQSSPTNGNDKNRLIKRLLSKMLKENTIDAFLFSLSLGKDRLKLFSKYIQETILNSTGMQAIGRSPLESDLAGLKNRVQLLVERIGLQVTGWEKSRKLAFDDVKESEDRATQRLFFYQKARELSENANIQRKLSTLLEISRFIKTNKNVENLLAKEFLFAVIVPIIDRLDRMDSSSLPVLCKIIRNSITSGADFSRPTFFYLIESIISKGDANEDEIAELRLMRAVFTADSCNLDFCTNYTNSVSFAHKFNKLTTWILRTMGEEVERTIKGEYLSYTNDDSDDSDKIGNNADDTGNDRMINAKIADKRGLDNNVNKKKLETNEDKNTPTGAPKKKKSQTQKNKKNDCSALSDPEDQFVDCSEIGFDEQFVDCAEEFQTINPLKEPTKDFRASTPFVDTNSQCIEDGSHRRLNCKRFIAIVTAIYKRMIQERPTLTSIANFYEIARKTAVLANLREMIMTDINKQLGPIKLAEAVELVQIEELINKEFIYDCILSQDLAAKKPQELFYQFINMISASKGNPVDDMLFLKIWDFGFFCPENHDEVMESIQKKLNEKPATKLPKSMRKEKENENKTASKDGANKKENKSAHCLNYVSYYGHYILRNYKKLEKLIETYKLKYKSNGNNDHNKNDDNADDEIFAVGNGCEGENEAICNNTETACSNIETASNSTETVTNEKAPADDTNIETASDESDRQNLRSEIVALRTRLRKYMRVYKRCFSDFESFIFPFWEAVEKNEFLPDSYIIYGINLEVESVLRKENMLSEARCLLPKPEVAMETFICSLFSSKDRNLFPCINEINKKILKRIVNEYAKAKQLGMRNQWAELEADELEIAEKQKELAALRLRTANGGEGADEKINELAQLIEESIKIKNMKKEDSNKAKRQYFNLMHIASNQLLRTNNSMDEIYTYYDKEIAEDAKKIILYCYFKQMCFVRADAKGRRREVVNPKFNKLRIKNYSTMERKPYLELRNKADVDIIGITANIASVLAARMRGMFLNGKIPLRNKLHEIKKSILGIHRQGNSRKLQHSLELQQL